MPSLKLIMTLVPMLSPAQNDPLGTLQVNVLLVGWLERVSLSVRGRVMEYTDYVRPPAFASSAVDRNREATVYDFMMGKRM
jgi:hypothetical protein